MSTKKGIKEQGGEVMSTKKGIKEQYSHLLIALNGGSIWQELDGGSLPHRPTSQRKKEMSTEKQSVIVNGVEVKHPVERYMHHGWSGMVVACSPNGRSSGTTVYQGSSSSEKGHFCEDWSWTNYPKGWEDVTAEWRAKEQKCTTEKKYTTAPFDLEAFKNGAPAVTRDGRKAKFVYYNDTFSSDFKLYAEVEGVPNLVAYTNKGHYHDENAPSSNDLLMLVEEKPKKTVYVNLYKNSHYSEGEFTIHDSAKEATAVAGNKALAIDVPVEIEE